MPQLRHTNRSPMRSNVRFPQALHSSMSDAPGGAPFDSFILCLSVASFCGAWRCWSDGKLTLKLELRYPLLSAYLRKSTTLVGSWGTSPFVRRMSAYLANFSSIGTEPKFALNFFDGLALFGQVSRGKEYSGKLLRLPFITPNT
jgi:hypothetical protein